MKNKTKAWRKAEPQQRFLKDMIQSDPVLAAKITAGRVRIGRIIRSKEHILPIPSLLVQGLLIQAGWIKAA